MAQRDHHFAWRRDAAISGVEFGSCVIVKLQYLYDSLGKRSETEIADFKIIQLKQQGEWSWATRREDDLPQSLTRSAVQTLWTGAQQVPTCVTAGRL